MRKIIFLFLIFLCTDSYAQKIVAHKLELSDFDYPFDVSFLEFNIQGESLKMAYMDVKPDKPNGRVIVLLHGKNFCGAYWENAAKELSKRGFRVIIPDQIGFGKSSKPVNMQFSFNLMAKNSKSLLDTLGISNAIVVGHSTGGMLAVRFSLLYPDMVSKLILEDPLGFNKAQMNINDSTVDDYYEKELSQDYVKIRKYQRDNYYHGTWNDEFDKWARLQAGWTLNENYSLIARISAKVYEMIHTQPIADDFVRLQIPILTIAGDLDPMFNANDMKKTNGTNTIVVIPNTGHVPHLESFDLFTKAVLKFIG